MGSNHVFLIDEADHFIEHKFIQLMRDGGLEGLVVLKANRVYMFSATLVQHLELLLTVGMGFKVSIQRELAIRAIINGSTDVAEFYGTVQPDAESCFHEALAEVQKWHSS